MHETLSELAAGALRPIVAEALAKVVRWQELTPTPRREEGHGSAAAASDGPAADDDPADVQDRVSR